MDPEARSIFERFRRYPGSDWIAKPQAVSGVMECIAEIRPRAILEVGAGIGTVTCAILSALARTRQDSRFVAIEHDSFCLGALAEHIGQDLSRVDLRPDVADLEPAAFDLIIVDGGTVERGGYVELLAPGGTMIVEGGRQPQRAAMEKAGRPFIVRQVGSVHWDGGWYWRMKFEPTTGDRLHFMALSLWDRHLIMPRRRARQVLVHLGRWARRVAPSARKSGG
jgi:protein-L-isoaspartate O-methyltransferase